MESPVSAVVSNLYMEIFQWTALDSAPCKPKFLKRYVDDTFAILDRDRVDVFLKHLNSQQPSIRFIMEIENDSKITFPDMSVFISLPSVPRVAMRVKKIAYFGGA